MRRGKPGTTVVVGIGSNRHPRREIRAGLDRLVRRFGRLDISPVYRSAAIGFDGPSFLNLVVRFDSALSAERIVAILRDIEHGRPPLRHRNKKSSSRRLDLDLLLYGDECRNDGHLKLPRDDIANCAYTLWPLADIAGSSRHPETLVTYRTMRARFSERQHLRRISFVLRGRPLPTRSKC